MSWRRDLLWFFANGHRVTQLTSVGVPDTGVRGSGNSGTKGVFCNWDFDPEDLEKYGGISRRLERLTAKQRDVLALAYGDAGMAVTDACLFPQRRWRALAALSAVARERGAKRKTKGEAIGCPAARFANELLGKASPSLAERATLRDMQVQCTMLLREAEGAFAGTYGVAVAA